MNFDPVPLLFDGGFVLVDETYGRLHVLNAGAAAIWALRRQSMLPVSECAQLLCARYGIERRDAEAAIEAAEQGWANARVGLEPLVDVPPRIQPRPSLNTQPAHYRIDGLTIAVSCADIESRGRLEALLHDKAVPPSPADLTVRIIITAEDCLCIAVNGTDHLVVHESGEVIGYVFQLIVDHAHPDAGCLAWIHAAALATEAAVLLMPGRSGAGKTTLAAYLAMQGYQYLADDLVALDGGGGILSWTPPLCIKSGSWPLLSPHCPVIDTLPEQVVLQRRVKYLPILPSGELSEQRAPDAIVFPEWMVGTTPSLTRIAPLEAMAKLVSERLWLGYPLRPEKVQAFLDWLGDKPAYALRYDSLEGAARQLAALTAAPWAQEQRSEADGTSIFDAAS